MSNVFERYGKIGVEGTCYFPKEKAPRIPELPSGMYEIYTSLQGIYFSTFTVESEEYIKLPESDVNEIYKEINNFWNPETKAQYEKYNLLYKRGILLYGKPGTGKTSLLMHIAREFINNYKGIVLFNPKPSALVDGIKYIQDNQPNIPIMVILEEIENLADDTRLLSFLDGEEQTNNVLLLATTNYINRLPPRLINRPSRFATVKEIGPPSAANRKVFLEAKLKDSVNIDLWVRKTNGFVIDQLKDLIISVCCLGLSLDNAIKKLTELYNSGDYETNDYETDNYTDNYEKQ